MCLFWIFETQDYDVGDKSEPYRTQELRINKEAIRRAEKTCSPEEEFRKVMINGKSGTEIMLYNFYTAYIQRLKLFL